MRFNKVSFLFLYLLIIPFTFVQNQVSKSIPYRFDAGGDNSIVKDHFQFINENTSYNSERGFGWLEPPTDTYYHHKLKESTLRDELTIDGVIGKSVSFKADIPQGNWWFTFWMEVGNDYTNTASLRINNIEKDIKGQKFKFGESGSDSHIPVYRVFHTKIKVSKNGFSFQLVGNKDLIRLCGLTLIPESEPVNDKQKQIKSMLSEAGKYNSKISLINIEKHLNILVNSNFNDSYYSYWYQQVKLLAEAERIKNMMGWEWARELTKLSIFTRQEQVITLLEGIIENNSAERNPLYEKALFMRAKVLYDIQQESGGDGKYYSYNEDFKYLYDLYPTDLVLAMFNGEKIDFSDPIDYMKSSSKAPRWSVLQRELYNRLSDEIDWWVNERQAPNGELGGKLGDDVELLRWWSAFLLTDNKVAIDGWQKLADAVWNSPRVHNGYSKFVYDVEHASEYISDSTPELILIDNDSLYIERLKFTADHFENLWSEKNRNGNRFFKSAWYSSTEVDETPPKNKDVDYNARALKPLRYLAYISKDKRYIKLLHEWSLAWVNASLETSKGKPIGLIPASVRGYDEKFNGDGKNWYEADTFWQYFNWQHSVGSKILDNIIFTYSLVKDEKILAPFEHTLKLINDYKKKDPSFLSKSFPKGSTGWIVKKLVKNNNFWNVIDKYILITNNVKYNNLLHQYGNDYTKYKLTGNVKYLENNLNRTLKEIRYNTPLRTELVVHTDRVRNYGANTLKAMLTGDGTSESTSPYYAVTWEKTNRDFTALVHNFNENKISVKLFSHSKTAYKITARFWMLKEGNYTIRLEDTSENILMKENLTINKRGDRFNFTIPANKLIKMIVE